ncbi:hypothetical protein CK203_030719 [Vitis vinifera]|uniref:Uncharacterized protein n=1 Tax=Vitis vinifera TaxID=29760 RepID=A0A438IRF6_VITVI|nr:hypothetical protein CK203_030719 [Vitis vinifera]
MADWGPVIVATVLFVLLTPGLLFQIPAKGRLVEFGNMSTSGLSILVHAVIYLVVPHHLPDCSRSSHLHQLRIDEHPSIHYMYNCFCFCFWWLYFI